VRLLNLSGRDAPARCDPAAGAAAVLERFALVELGAAGGTGPRDQRKSGAGKGRGDRQPMAAADAEAGGDRAASSIGWVARLAADMGSRGLSGPVYGALARWDADLADDLASAAALADPGVLWLVGTARAGAAGAQAAGWTVAGETP
jgi:hypothetical protein